MLAVITPITINKHKIDSIAKAKGGVIGKLLVRSPYLESTLEYVPAYFYTFYFRGEKFSLLKKPVLKEGEISLVGDSQSMRIGVIESAFPLEEAEIAAEAILQNKDDFDEQKNIERAERLARKAVTLKHRISPKLNYLGKRVFYRPRWISVYGTAEEITHRLVTPADNFKFVR